MKRVKNCPKKRISTVAARGSPKKKCTRFEKRPREKKSRRQGAPTLQGLPNRKSSLSQREETRGKDYCHNEGSPTTTGRKFGAVERIRGRTESPGTNGTGLFLFPTRLGEELVWEGESFRAKVGQGGDQRCFHSQEKTSEKRKRGTQGKGESGGAKQGEGSEP